MRGEEAENLGDQSPDVADAHVASNSVLNDDNRNVEMASAVVDAILLEGPDSVEIVPNDTQNVVVQARRSSSPPITVPIKALCLGLNQMIAQGKMSKACLVFLLPLIYNALPETLRCKPLTSKWCFFKYIDVINGFTLEDDISTYLDPQTGRTVYFKNLLPAIEDMCSSHSVTQGWVATHEAAMTLYGQGHPVSSRRWMDIERHYRNSSDANGYEHLGLAVFADSFKPRHLHSSDSFTTICIGIVNSSREAQARECSKAVLGVVPSKCCLYTAICEIIIKPLLKWRKGDQGGFLTLRSFANGPTEKDRVEARLRPFIFVVCGDDPGQRYLSGLAGHKNLNATPRYHKKLSQHINRKVVDDQPEDSEAMYDRNSSSIDNYLPPPAKRAAITSYSSSSSSAVGAKVTASTSSSIRSSTPMSSAIESIPDPLNRTPKSESDFELCMTKLDGLHRDHETLARVNPERLKTKIAQTREAFHSLGLKSSTTNEGMLQLTLPPLWQLDEFKHPHRYFFSFGLCTLHLTSLGLVKWFCTRFTRLAPPSDMHKAIAENAEKKYADGFLATTSTSTKPVGVGGTASWWEGFFKSVFRQHVIPCIKDERTRLLASQATASLSDIIETAKGDFKENLTLQTTNLSALILQWKKQTVQLFGIDEVSYNFPNWENIDAYPHIIQYLGAPCYYDTQRFEAVNGTLKRISKFSNHADLSRDMLMNSSRFSKSSFILKSIIDRELVPKKQILTGKLEAPQELVQHWREQRLEESKAESTTCWTLFQALLGVPVKDLDTNFVLRSFPHKTELVRRHAENRMLVSIIHNNQTLNCVIHNIYSCKLRWKASKPSAKATTATRVWLNFWLLTPSSEHPSYETRRHFNNKQSFYIQTSDYKDTTFVTKERSRDYRIQSWNFQPKSSFWLPMQDVKWVNVHRNLDLQLYEGNVHFVIY